MSALRTTRLIAVLAAFGVASSGSVALAAPKPKTKTSATKATKSVSKPARKPDLVVRALQTELFELDSVRVRASVGLVGRVAPKRASRTTIALSSDTRLGPGDTILAEIRTGRAVRGQGAKIDRMLSLPETLPQSDTYLVICADSGNRIAEARENNNCQSELLWEAGELDDEDYEDDEGYDDEDAYEDEGAYEDEESADWL